MEIVPRVSSPSPSPHSVSIIGNAGTGFARGAEEANIAINQFDKGSLKSIDADKPPSCPLADKQDDYCDGWKDGWRETILDKLDSLFFNSYFI